MTAKDASPELRFDAHPPERRRGSTTLMVHGCCCCCLHSLGGLAGAVAASFRWKRLPPESLMTEAALRDDAELRQAQRFAVKVYWLALSLVITVSVAVSTFANPGFVGGLGPFLIIVFFLPAAQLGASLLTLFYVLIRPPLRKRDCLRRLGKITLFAILGALLGSLSLWLTIVFS